MAGVLGLTLGGGGCAARPVTPTLPAQESAAPKSGAPPTLEALDPGLADALKNLAVEESVDTLQRVAAEYLRLRVFDSAQAYLTRAIALDPRRSSSFDWRARVWRDWGLPDLALGDAHRAVFLAPGSADAHNTLGTVLFALGSLREAESAFETALARDPTAAWIQNNLCYVALSAGNEARALARCAEALDHQPDLTPARNNLALVHAAAGRLDEARAAFLRAGPRSSALYNMGVVLLARRDYAAAVESFEAACRAEPAHEASCARAAQTRVLAARASKGKRP